MLGVSIDILKKNKKHMLKFEVTNLLNLFQITYLHFCILISHGKIAEFLETTEPVNSPEEIE